MADKRIKVVLLEGEFTALSAIGFPTSVCLQLLDSGLKVTEEAMWSTRYSSAGFSVSFFWPALANPPRKVSKCKRRRCHRNTNATTTMSKSSSIPVISKEPVVQPSNGERSNAASVIPINDHQTTTEINLTKCHSVFYEKKGDQHGVTYHTSDNEQEWTPVVKKGRKHQVVHRPQAGLRTAPTSGPVNQVVIPATLTMIVQ